LYTVSRRSLSNDQDWAGENQERFVGRANYGRSLEGDEERETVKYLLQARSRPFRREPGIAFGKLDNYFGIDCSKK
jgi:hypothetical protein